MNNRFSFMNLYALHRGIIYFTKIFNIYNIQRVLFELNVYEADGIENSGTVGLVLHIIDLPVGEQSEPLTFSYEQQDRASIELSFKVVCAENFYGRDCSRFCNLSSCPCEPGLTGEFCHETDDCFGIQCGENQQCTDGKNDYTCVCIPGFAGESCEVDLNECVLMNINCSGHGLCKDGRNNYSCICDDGYTGTSCNISKLI